MSDINERLTALDPASNNPYRPAHLDEMISRIVATSPSGRARSMWWQRAQLTFAGALILGTAIGATTVALLSGSGLPALAIQAIPTPSAFGSAFAVQRPYEEIDFAPTASLGASSPSSLSFKVESAKDPVAELTDIASVFRVGGTTHHTNDEWTITSPSGATVNYQTSGSAPQWYYSSSTPQVAPATASSSATVAMPSHAALEQQARGYLKRLGFNYGVSSPSFTTTTVSSTSASGGPSAQPQEEVTYIVTVNGLDTDQSVEFSVGASGTLLYAQGPAFGVSSGIDYPLQSPASGVNTLDATEHNSFPSSTQGKALAPPVVHAALTSVRLTLATFRLKNGTTWLLPLYTYAGTLTQTNSATSSGSWSEIALQPSYVQISTSAARSVVNY